MDSNFATGFTVAAGMIGSVTLVLPGLFKEQGIISCLLVMVFMAFVYCRTCQLWMIHWKPGEEDISEIVKRTLGPGWYIVLGVSSGIFLLMISVIYFLLLNKTLYPVITYLLSNIFKTNKFHNGTDGIHFEVFSIQYLGIINLLLLAKFYNLDSINNVVKLARYGVVFLVIYFLTLVGMFVTSTVQHGFQPDRVKLVADSFDGWIQIAGQFSLAFVSHNTIITVTKNNKSRREIPRAIAYGFGVAGVLYTLFGVFGGMAISIQDYFLKSPFLQIVGVSISLYVVSIYGIFPYVSRTQFFCWRQDNGPLPRSLFFGYNFFVMLVCGIMQTINVSPGIVIAITGSGVGIITCFVLPIWIHLRCYKPKQFRDSVGSLITDYEQSLGTKESFLQEEDTLEVKKPVILLEGTDCVLHQPSTMPYSIRVGFYACLLVVGFINFGLQVKQIVE